MPETTNTMSEWTERGRVVAKRLLAAGVSAFQLSDLKYRFGALMRHFGAGLAALVGPCNLSPRSGLPYSRSLEWYVRGYFAQTC